MAGSPVSYGQESDEPGEKPPTTIITEVEAGESDAEKKRQWIKWNEFDGPITTFRYGMGFLTDFAFYSQDEDSEQQVGELDDGDVGVRDFRVMFNGKFKTERPFTWTVGIMYDGADEAWHFRQTGLMIGIPEVDSRVFIGRTKEGYSLIKVMTGYYGWTIERSPALDAFVPILADGVKWMYYGENRRIFLSAGYYVDTLSEDEKFATSDNQAVVRLGFQPLLSEPEKEVLHLAVMGRRGEPDEGRLQVRSRPEVYLAPFFIDTGSIESDLHTTTGFEAFYRKGSWLFGTEYNWQEVEAVTGEKPVFHAGEAVATWIITGETRPYNASGAYFGMVSPETSVFEGGWGAVEAVFKVSYSDFDDLSFEGGTFWRVTPMVNWYLSDFLRLELAYGYGELDRFGITGETQFLHGRLQFAF